MCKCTFPSTAMPPNFIHFHQKVNIKSVLESCDHLRTALFTGFYPHSCILSSHNAIPLPTCKAT